MNEFIPEEEKLRYMKLAEERQKELLKSGVMKQSPPMGFFRLVWFMIYDMNLAMWGKLYMVIWLASLTLGFTVFFYEVSRGFWVALLHAYIVFLISGCIPMMWIMIRKIGRRQ